MKSKMMSTMTSLRAAVASAAFLSISVALCTAYGGAAAAQDKESFPAEQIAGGGRIYARNCAPCHGGRMLDPEGAFNLRKFPSDQRERFNNSVTRGKNQMPPWGDLLQPGDLDLLWAYVMAGER